MDHADPDHVPPPLAALIARRAEEAPASVFLVAVRDEGTLSFAQLADATDAGGERLRGVGLDAGDRIGLSITDPLAFATTFLAGLAAGLWVAPLDPSLEASDPALFEERAVRIGVDALLSDRGAPGQVALRRLGDASAARRSGDGTGGVILASSGTTGTPKVMRLPAAQLLATAELIAAHNALGPSDRGLNPLPLFHVNAEVVGLLATLVAGASLALDDRFHRTDFWAIAGRLGATWVNAVPAIIARLTPLREGEVVPTGLRFVRSASAPLSASLLDAFERTTGLAVVESYGMTEAASQICANPLAGPRKAGSVGRPIGVRLRVRTAAGDPAATGEVGGVEICGPTVIGAYESPGYEDRFSADGWLRTGDLGYLDEDGYLFLAGRSDDVINRGGEKIFPREIEEVLLEVPEVEAVAVIGVADDVFGQLPIAYVQLAGVDAGSGLESVLPILKDIRERLVAAFARTRRPVSVNVLAALPTHATGKVQKGALRAAVPEVLFSEVVG